MSRKGKMPITLPTGVEVKCDSKVVTVKGPKGTLEQTIRPEVEVSIKDNVVQLSVAEGALDASKFLGLYRTLVDNMVFGVTKGWDKVLELIGVGYRAAVKGKDLDLQLGYSHPTALAIPEGITVTVEKNTVVTVSGASKQLVGQFAANIRGIRPPEPYKGKGVRYRDEYVRRKAGKSAGRK